MNPLEDIVVAVKAKVPTLPFAIPDSVRPLDVTMPLSSTTGFANVDPLTNNPITVTNDMTDFGWEYVWHCHLLGHEENDMMRPLVVKVAPDAPQNLTATSPGESVNPPSVALSWVSTSAANATFTIQRATDAAFTTNVTTLPPVLSPTTTFTDTPLPPDTTFYYRVRADNGVGISPCSNTASARTSGWLPLAPTGLGIYSFRVFPGTLFPHWTLPVADGVTAATRNGIYVERSRRAANGVWGPWARVATLAPNATQYSDTGLARRATYRYRVQAFNSDGSSAYSNVAQGTTF